MKQGLTAWAVAGVFCLLPVTSVADELTGTRLNTGFVERGNNVFATLHEGYATLVVQRQFENVGTTIDEATWRLDVPDTAVATGLRTQGMNGGIPVWYQGQLLPAETAASRYRYLTGFGQARPRDPALLYWISPNSLGLQIFPCAPSEPKAVEYTLQVPMRYEKGHYLAAIPALGRAGKAATIEARSASAQATALLDGIELSRDASGIRREHNEAFTIELRPNAAPPISAELAVADLGTGRSYVRAELRAAAKISSIPVTARLVFLFDQSRSVGESWAPQREAFEELVELFPQAEVLAIGFDRVARNITQGFTTVARAKELVAAFPSATRNGSRIDLALAEATSILGKARKQGRETRVFLLTDALNPSSIPSAAIEAQIRGLSSLTHVAEVSSGECGLTHREEHDWYAAVEATGGTVWNAFVSQDDCREQLEELARPKRYFLKTLTLDPGTGHVELPETLDEGASFELERVQTGKPTVLALEAKLWGKPVSKRWTTDAEMSKIRAAFATTSSTRISSDGSWDLTEAEQLRLALFSGAVTPFTSYLAVEPGVRPSTAGFLDRGGGGIGIGAAVTRSFGHGAGRGSSRRFDPQEYIEGVVDRIRRLCGLRFQRLTVEIETSFAEIVDVPRSEIPDSPPSASGCITANLWDEILPNGFDKARARYVVVR